MAFAVPPLNSSAEGAPHRYGAGTRYPARITAGFRQSLLSDAVRSAAHGAIRRCFHDRTFSTGPGSLAWKVARTRPDQRLSKGKRRRGRRASQRLFPESRIREREKRRRSRDVSVRELSRSGRESRRCGREAWRWGRRRRRDRGLPIQSRRSRRSGPERAG